MLPPPLTPQLNASRAADKLQTSSRLTTYTWTALIPLFISIYMAAILQEAAFAIFSVRVVGYKGVLLLPALQDHLLHHGCESLVLMVVVPFECIVLSIVVILYSVGGCDDSTFVEIVACNDAPVFKMLINIFSVKTFTTSFLHVTQRFFISGHTIFPPYWRADLEDKNRQVPGIKGQKAPDVELGIVYAQGSNRG
ncbi:hypothetical protein DFH27DRAFT_617772 [Peziza echinospora]|nr:hypothetical protein DFH27DRAFT_617772 [Peziza echinospora]